METLHGKGEELAIDVISLLNYTLSIRKFTEKWGDNNTYFLLDNFLIPLMEASNKETCNLLLKKLGMFLAIFDVPINTSTEMEVIIGLN